MKNRLNKYRFRTRFSTEMKTESKKFYDKFSSRVEIRDYNFFSDYSEQLFSVFNKKKIIYKPFEGKISNTNFKIRLSKEKGIFNHPFATARGTIIEKENCMIIDTKINGFDYGFIPLYLILSIVFIVSIGFLFSDFGIGVLGILFSVGIYYFTSNLMMKNTELLRNKLINEFKIIE